MELAVDVRGTAVDLLVEDGVGPVRLTASEVIGAARRVVNGLVV